MIARAGTGVDNVDVPAASARGIVVMNAPGANSVSVAELAIGLMLGAGPAHSRRRRGHEAGQWEKKKFLGEELRGKTLGLAGLGRHRPGSGAPRRRRSACASSRTIPFISEQVAAGLGVELVSLDELFARADYLSLHMPSTPQTRQLVNAARLQRTRNRASGSSTPPAAISSTKRRWPTPSNPATSAARRSTSSRRNRPSTTGSRCFRR